MPIPLTVIVLKIGDRQIMIDAGSGVGQWQANATHLPANMKAAGIDGTTDQHDPGLAFPSRPRLGPDGEGHQRAGLSRSRARGERGRIQVLDRPEPRREACRRGAGPRRSASPTSSRPGRTGGSSKDGAEVAPGVRILDAPGHTPGHSVFLVASGSDQLMVSNDTMYVPALLAPHPDWQGSYDQDGPMAIATRRKIVDRVIADKMMICGAHFPFPGLGIFAKDGNAYAFTPANQA